MSKAPEFVAATMKAFAIEPGVTAEELGLCQADLERIFWRSVLDGIGLAKHRTVSGWVEGYNLGNGEIIEKDEFQRIAREKLAALK